MPQPLYPHRCRTLGTLQALHTGMCSGGGWPRDGGLVPSQRPRGCGQGTQRWEDGGEGPGGESGDGDSQVGNKPSVKRTLSALVSGGAPKGCVWGSRTVLGWPQGFLPAQSGNFGLHKAAAGGDLRSPVLTRGGEGAEDRRALSPQPFWLPSALHQGGSPGLRTPGQGKQRSPAQCPPPQFSISPPDP